MSIMMTPPATYWLGWLSFFNFSSQSTGYCIAPLTSHQQILLSVTMPFILITQLGMSVCLASPIQYPSSVLDDR
jgi:hypothetical protein